MGTRIEPLLIPFKITTTTIMPQYPESFHVMPQSVVKPTVQRILKLTDRVSDYLDTEVSHARTLREVEAVVSDLKRGTYGSEEHERAVEDLAKVERLQNWLESALEKWTR